MKYYIRKKNGCYKVYTNAGYNKEKKRCLEKNLGIIKVDTNDFCSASERLFSSMKENEELYTFIEAWIKDQNVIAEQRRVKKIAEELPKHLADIAVAIKFASETTSEALLADVVLPFLSAIYPSYDFIPKKKAHYMKTKI